MKRYMIPIFIAGAALVAASSSWAKSFSHDNHVKDYAAGDCFSCHQPTDRVIFPNLAKCDDCHDKGYTNDVTFTGLKTHGPAWSLEHGPYAKLDQDKCLNCHSDVKGPIGCSTCHQGMSPGEAGTTTKGMLNVHRAEFKISHPLAARANTKVCQSCHSNKFCSDCHEAFEPDKRATLSHRKSWSAKDTGRGPHEIETGATCGDCHGPNSILPEKHAWTDSHAREARRNLATCQACHPDGDVCMNCHSAKTGLKMNPHPKGWGGSASSRLDSASGGKTCRKCH